MKKNVLLVEAADVICGSVFLVVNVGRTSAYNQLFSEPESVPIQNPKAER